MVVAGAVALACAALASLAVGSVDLHPAVVIDAFLRFDGSEEHLIVQELRVPRTVLGAAVGAALGMAGAVMQAVTRNPLAEPGILGINGGAALGVVLGISLFGLTSPGEYLGLAMLGGVATAGALALLGSSGRSGGTPVRLILAGAVLAALLASITSAILVVDQATLNQYRFWIVGSLAGRSLDIMLVVGPILVVGGVVAIGASRALNALALGVDLARAIGARVGLVRALATLSVVLLASGSVALAGPIAFVGLAVPHIARLAVGPDWRWIVPISGLIGPTLLLVADVLGRIVVRPSELQVGVVSALIGAPLFVLLVRRRRLVEL